MNHDIRFAIEVAVRALILFVILRVFIRKDQAVHVGKIILIALGLGLLSGVLGLVIELWVFPVMLVVTLLVLRFGFPLTWGNAILATIIYVVVKMAISYGYFITMR